MCTDEQAFMKNTNRLVHKVDFQTMDKLYILIELARWDRSGRLLQTLTCASKPLFTFFKKNKSALAALRDSWLTVVNTGTAIRYYDWCWRLHRLDGPASEDAECGSIWFARDVPHRADGIAHDRTNAWIQQGRVLYANYFYPQSLRRSLWERVGDFFCSLDYESLAEEYARQRIYLRAYAEQIMNELHRRHTRGTFAERWDRWLFVSTGIYNKICKARDAYWRFRQAALENGTWYQSRVCSQMQQAVDAAFGITQRPMMAAKRLRARQVAPKLRSRTPPYLGGVTGRMRQR